MKIAIFLGAGASKAEGAPLQGEMFKQFFNHILSKPPYYNKSMTQELLKFFKFMFNLEIKHSTIDELEFPTFEEVLGIIDQAIMREESFINYELENLNNHPNKLRNLKLYIIMSMAQIIHYKLINCKGLHKKLCRHLANSYNIQNVVFITTNYDILIDNALTDIGERNSNYMLDYGTEFTNFNNSDDWRRPIGEGLKLYKLHGSLNWLFCPTCNSLTLTPKEKGIIKLLPDRLNTKKKNCTCCNSTYTPLLIPPSYFKNMNNPFLGNIWNRTEQELRRIEHIIFCGYSFPDADVHVKYLLKRIQTNRSNSIKFTIVNNHINKERVEKKQEEERYKRFLGNNVNYTDLSFEEFVKDPLTTIEY